MILSMQSKLIVFVTNSLWNETHRGRHHLAQVASASNAVLWVNRRYTFRDKASKAGLEQAGDGLYVLHTGKSLLPRRIDLKYNWDNRMRLKMLDRALKHFFHRAEPDLLWIYDYKGLPFVQNYSGVPKLYYCNDFFGDYAYERYEKALASAVNCVFCTAPKLKDRLADYNENCHFLPHGVWLPNATPNYVKKGWPETVGYIGALRWCIDLSFLKNIIDQTDLRLILAGPIIECTNAQEKALRDFLSLPKVEYLGNLSREQIWEQMANIDIGLLPYLVNHKLSHNFVIKYFDYLAFGKPIIATPYFEWPEPYGNFVSVYKPGTDLKSFIDEVYARHNQEMYNAALSLAAESTWENRFKRICELMRVD